MSEGAPFCIVEPDGAQPFVSFGGMAEDRFLRILEDFKATVPAMLRRFDHEERRWRINFGARDRLQQWMRRWFADQADGGLQHAYDVLWLKAGAPFALVQAAYRCLARQYHPDLVGGDGEHMRQLNAALETLRAIAEPADGDAA